MRSRVTVIRTVLLVAVLLAAVGVASADTVIIQELTQAQFVFDFGSGTGTFNGVTGPGTFVSETSLVLGGVTYDDQSKGELFAVGSGLGFDIGTGNTLLIDNGAGDPTANINMTFGTPAVAVGLIAGDPDPGDLGGGTGVATFNVTFGDGSSITDLGGDGSLPILTGDPANYFVIFDIGGNGISQLNFSTNLGDPALDTVTTSITAQGLATIPEPNSVWLLAILMLALGIGYIIRKRKTAAAHVGSGAAPLAVLAVFAVMAVPSRSFAQVNCNLAVPNNPLTAAGLASPYLLSAGDTGCSQAAGSMAFVQAAIYDPAAHTISVYTPLVADRSE